MRWVLMVHSVILKMVLDMSLVVVMMVQNALWIAAIQHLQQCTSHFRIQHSVFLIFTGSNNNESGHIIRTRQLCTNFWDLQSKFNPKVSKKTLFKSLTRISQNYMSKSQIFLYTLVVTPIHNSSIPAQSTAYSFGTVRTLAYTAKLGSFSDIFETFSLVLLSWTRTKLHYESPCPHPYMQSENYTL